MKKTRGFTLIELTIVAAIMAIVAGFFIVRWGMFSSRQQAIAVARQLGGVIAQYREQAQSEESLYAVMLDLEHNRYAVYRVSEKNPAALENAQALRTCELSPPVKFGKVLQGAQPLTAPVFLFLDSKGILPALRIEIRSGTHCIALCPDPISSESHYDESQD